MSAKKPLRLNKNNAIERLRLDIIEQIQAGTLQANDPIIAAPELARRYQISYPTVHRILTGLVRDGLIYRIQGKGTFVAPNRHGGATSQTPVGILMRASGDLFGPLFSHISNQLQNAGRLCFAADPLAPAFLESPEICMRKMVHSGARSLIVEGAHTFPFDQLKAFEHHVQHLVFVLMMQTRIPFSADAVLSDFERGGYLAARHLINRGHRRLAVEIYTEKPSPNLEDQHSWMRLEGCRLACREAGIPESNLSLLPVKRLEPSLHALIQSEKPPTAIIASTDYEASKIYLALRSMGLHVPQDMSLLGYFNTSWCNRFDIPLASVSIREAVIAERAVAAIREKSEHAEAPCVRLLLEPEVIDRASVSRPKPSKKKNRD